MLVCVSVPMYAKCFSPNEARDSKAALYRLELFQVRLWGSSLRSTKSSCRAGFCWDDDYNGKEVDSVFAGVD